MRSNWFKSAALGTLAAVVAATGVEAQTSSEVEQLRREYDQQLRVMQQAFEERMSALEEKVKPGENDLQWYWKEGLRFETENGDFKFKFGGRIQWDSVWFDQDSDSENGKNGEFADSNEFRRARLEISGEIYKDFGFKAQYDFVENGDSEFKDVYIDYNNIPVIGTVRAGHFKEPFSLDELTSSKDITFMERGFPNDMTPGRNAGVMVTNAWVDDKITGAVGVFREADGDGDAFQDGGYSLTGRFTGRPWVTEDERRYIHLGAAASLREDFNNDSANAPFAYTSDGEVHLAPTFLDTGGLRIEDITLLGAEAAVVIGPFHAQGEYIYSYVDQKGGDSLDYDGWYLQAGYFLTGEARRYKAGEGVFDKVKPNNNFQISEDGGWGAWEIAARYSQLNLDDTDNLSGDVEQGEGEGITVGLNWYMNANLKWMLNYNHVELDYQDGTEEDFDSVQTRLQVTW